MDKNRTGDDALTDLSLAVNNLEEVNNLLYNGAEPNLKDKKGCTALHYSAWQDTDVEISKLLISYGADCNAVQNEQATPLHIAARNGNEKTCQLLLQHGAN